MRGQIVVFIGFNVAAVRAKCDSGNTPYTPFGQHTLPHTHAAIYSHRAVERNPKPLLEANTTDIFIIISSGVAFFIISRGKATRRLLLYISLCVLFGLRAYNRVNNYPWD